MKLSLLCPAVLLSIATAAQPVLVQDIMPGVFSSNPSRLTPFNNKLYFFATDGVHGVELWSDNGTKAAMEHDIFNGSKDCTGFVNNLRSAVLNGKMYFPADNGTSGLELFSFDGINAPVLVSDIRGGLDGSKITELVALNGKLYFNADNGTNGLELWEHDPASVQTSQVSFINTVAQGGVPRYLTTANGKLYFTAFVSATGRELYEYDPSSGVTKPVSDIYPGTEGSDPQCLTELGGKLYFVARTPDYGRELHVYDGNAIQRLTDYYPGKTDGTSIAVDGLSTLGAIGNSIYFAGDDGTNGFQLSKYDATTNTASFVAMIDPNGNSVPAGFIYYANKIFFTANDGTHGRELWMIDGNDPPVMVADINTNAAVPTAPAGMVVYNNDLYFSAYGDYGNELYKLSDAKAGIADRTRSTAVKAYPNPANDFVHIELSLLHNEELFVRVMDATGRAAVTSRPKMYNEQRNRITIPLSDLPAGMYFYNIINTEGAPVAVGRIVKI